MEPSIQKSGLAELAAAPVAAPPTRPEVGAEASVPVALGVAEAEGGDEDVEEGMVTLSMLRWRLSGSGVGSAGTRRLFRSCEETRGQSG